MSCDKSTKMTGYLEKRGKLSITGRWKKWWCVLEGQLLLYYKSRFDYANLSPCCGSLNMALVRNVQPNIGYQIHIVTHTQLIILRTKNKEKQQQWFHALVGVLPQNSYLSPLFYFSTHATEYKRKSDRKKRKNKRKSFMESKKSSQSSEGQYAFSDALENRITTEIQSISTNQDRAEFQTENINVSRLLECNVLRDKMAQSSIKYSSEINIRRYSSYQSVNAAFSRSEENMHRRSISCECVFTDYRITSVERYEFLKTFSTQSDQKIADDSTYHFDSVPSVKCESNEVSICRRGTIHQKYKNESKTNRTLSKRSFSFLKKIFKRKNKKIADLSPTSFSENSNKEIQTNRSETTEEINGNSIAILDIEKCTPKSSISDMEKRISICTIENDESTPNEIEEITINDNFEEEKTANIEYEIETRSKSSCTDSENNIEDSLQVEERLPDLPVKNGNRSSRIRHDFDHVISEGHKTNNFSDEICTKDVMDIDTYKNMDLDSLLLQLTTLNNNECDKSHQSLEFNNNVIEDPDYDIPRPHTSLISETDSDASNNDKNHSHYLSNGTSIQKYNDSLSIDMAPDSLEMPWLLNDNTCNINYWTTKRELNLCLENDSGSEYDYHDSLNSNSKYCS